MKPRDALAEAIKRARVHRGLTQEDFSLVSSRTYVSKLERGGQSPTIEKVDALAKHMDLHPLTVLAMSYAEQGFRGDTKALLKKVAEELAEIQKSEKAAARVRKPR